jgi:hypothetical protein
MVGLADETKRLTPALLRVPPPRWERSVKPARGFSSRLIGAANGTRTRDPKIHNLVL